MMSKKVILPLCVLLGFACWLLFISTSITWDYSSGAEVRSVAVGFGTPWYQQISSPGGSSRELNFLAPSFLLGILGLLLLGGSVRYSQANHRK